MRLIGLLAATTGALMLASACGDGGGGTTPRENEAPVANFTVPSCTVDVTCNFASTSTDDEQVTEWSWDLNGDGTPDANTANASFIYRTAGDFDVSLTVGDAEGLSHTKTSTITIAPSVNTPPTASFTSSCTAADCTFTSTSTDAAPGTIATYAWTFGDGATAEIANPSHSYAVTAPMDFTVTLTVTDNQGATDAETQTVSVAPPPNTPPTAGFTHTCNAGTCTFTSTSTDVAPGTIVSHAWTFGDGGTSDVMNPLHSYAVTASRDFIVTLTVTDNEGVTDTETQTVTVSPPPPTAEGCVTNGTRVECAFNIVERSTVRLKLIDLNCDLSGQRIITPPPIGDQVFLNVCLRTEGQELGIFGGPLDEAIIFEAGTQVRIWFVQGQPDRDHPVLGPPAAQWSGTFPEWTVSFEDGANPGGAGEPDFLDVVLGVRAIPAP